MDGVAFLFHDPTAAESALGALERLDVTPEQVVHAPQRVLLAEERPSRLLRAGAWGLGLGVAAFVGLTVASIVWLGGGSIPLGTLVFVLVHGAMIGAVFGAAYAMQGESLTSPDPGLTLHGDDVLVVTPGDRTDGRVRTEMLDRGARCVEVSDPA